MVNPIRFVKVKCEEILFRLFSYTLKKYDVEFYYKDKLSILSKREHGDNFKYMFMAKASCDAQPMMLALDKIAANRRSNIILIPKAVSNFTGKTELNISESYGGHSLGDQHMCRFILNKYGYKLYNLSNKNVLRKDMPAIKQGDIYAAKKV